MERSERGSGWRKRKIVYFWPLEFMEVKKLIQKKVKLTREM